MRREADAIALRIGFGEEDRGRVAIVVTELGTNLLKHAKRGEILIDTAGPGLGGLEVLALDQGPGMVDTEACLADGYSTAGSQGTGLGAIKRQAAEFDVYSQPGLGTTVRARLMSRNATGAHTRATNWAALARALPGEQACGDDFAIREDYGTFVALVADGLGHGAFAAQASNEAVKLFESARSRDADEIAQAIHAGLKATRGAAIAIASVDLSTGVVTYSGIGNIAGALLSANGLKKMVSQNGTAGLVARRVQAFQYPFRGEALLIMHSDGISTSWSLDKYPGLAQRDPILIAAVLYRDWSRARDDATILVARLKQ